MVPGWSDASSRAWVGAGGEPPDSGRWEAAVRINLCIFGHLTARVVWVALCCLVLLFGLWRAVLHVLRLLCCGCAVLVVANEKRSADDDGGAAAMKNTSIAQNDTHLHLFGWIHISPAFQ